MWLLRLPLAQLSQNNTVVENGKPQKLAFLQNQILATGNSRYASGECFVNIRQQFENGKHDAEPQYFPRPGDLLILILSKNKYQHVIRGLVPHRIQVIRHRTTTIQIAHNNSKNISFEHILGQSLYPIGFATGCLIRMSFLMYDSPRST